MAIRVLHLIDSGGLYGAEMMLLDLVREQIRAGLYPVLLSAGGLDEDEKPIESEARKLGIPVETVRMRAGLNIIKAYRVLSYAKAQGFDLLHSHGYKFNILLGMIPRIVRKIPLITTLHGYVGAGVWSRLKLYQLVERMVLPHLDGIVFVSGNIRNNPLLNGFRAKHEVTILNGIDCAKVTAGAADSGSVSLRDVFPGEPEGNIYLGAAGRLSPEKGFDLLIDVFGRLQSGVPQLRLVIIGEGELRRQLVNKAASMGLAGKIRFPGFISPAYRLISELDGLVMPSFTEGLPMTLLEACILRKRIVASDVGSISEALAAYASSVVVKPGDAEMLQQAIKELIIDNASIEADIGDWDCDRFGAARMAGDYHGFYAEIIAAAG